MTGDLHRAEDLAQMAFQRVFAAAETWEPKARFSSFLWRIALNLCHDELRRITHRGECSLELLEAEDADGAFRMDSPGPDQEVERREIGEIVKQAVMRLEPLYREVLVLRHYEHLTFEQIAEILRIPTGTAKSRMAEALSRLSRLLKPLESEILCSPRIHRNGAKPA
jgi:RNA polymerase sigma-70 factor (ECF subfamily)